MKQLIIYTCDNSQPFTFSIDDNNVLVLARLLTDAINQHKVFYVNDTFINTNFVVSFSITDYSSIPPF